MTRRSLLMVSQKLFLALGLGLPVLTFVACSNSSAPKAPAKDDKDDEKSLDQEENLDEENGDDIRDEFNPTNVTQEVPLSIEVSNAAALKIQFGSPASIAFNLKDDTGKTVNVGLIQMPAGATLERSGSVVTFKWASPTGGTYPIKFLLRDQQKCEAAETTNVAACTLNPADNGKLVAKSYDVASQAFSLEVSTNDSLGLPPTGGAGGGLGGGNDQLIQQIIGLLGGGGGGDITALLQGLSSGQLNQILNQLQIGGGGGGITQLIGLLGNL